MLKIQGNDVMRGGTKVGYVTGNDIYDENGKKAGYFTSNDIYDERSRKRGYIEGNYLYLTEGGKINISENRRMISGGSLSDLARAAVRILLGD